jgi:hypothetical protein
VFVIHGCGRKTIEGHFENAENYLKELTGFTISDLLASDRKILLLFDEAQDSYWDFGLWVEMFKSVSSTTGPFIAPFCSFGSAGPESAIVGG